MNRCNFTNNADFNFFFVQHGTKMSLYLFELMHEHKNKLTKEDRLSVGALMNALKLCDSKYASLSAPPNADLIKSMKEVRESI